MGKNLAKLILSSSPTYTEGLSVEEREAMSASFEKNQNGLDIWKRIADWIHEPATV